MKRFVFTLIGLILISAATYSQIYDRRYNPNYMWTSFEEDFSGEKLDRSVWKPASRFKRNLGFLVDSLLTVKVEKGNLELKMRHAPHYLDSLWTQKGWRHEYSHYMGGEVSTHQKFRYGVFECRAKYALKSGSWPAFWLIGNDGTPCPPGIHGSEIDIAEVSCASDFPTMMHVIHRYSPGGNCEIATQVNKNEKRYSIRGRSKYVTYKCIWTPETIRYYVNDRLMHEVNNKGYEWFPSIPMNLILSQQVTQGFDFAAEVKPVTPQTSFFDWVKVRQFFLAPEITSPDSITLQGTATMHVDALATNISWQLSPAELFITSSGTEKKATISRINNSNGPGKITYTFQMPSGETYTAEKSFQ